MTRLVRWLLIAVIAPAAIWMAGRGVDRLWFGPESLTGASPVAVRVRQNVDAQYRLLFDELSAAANAAARRPDLVRTAREPASGRALFALAASAADQLRGSADRVALTIYDRAGQPVGWAGQPSDRPDVQNRSPGFLMLGGSLGVRLACVAAVIDSRTRVGTVIAERVLATGGDIRNRYIEPFDFTVAAASLPVGVAYVTSETDHERPSAAEVVSFVVRDPMGQPVARVTVPSGAREPGRQSLRTIVRTFATTVSLIGLVGLVSALGAMLEAAAGRIARLLAFVTMLWLLRVGIFWTALGTPWLASFDRAGYTSPRVWGLLRSPADFALTACAILGTTIAATVAFAWLRRTYRDRRLTVDPTARGLAVYGGIQAATALLVLAIVVGYHQFIAHTVAHSTIDLLHFSFHPWSAARLALQIGVIAFHVATALVLVLVFRLGLFIARRPLPRRSWLPAQVGVWTAGVILARALLLTRVDVPFWPSIAVYAAAAWSSYYADRLTTWIRRRAVSVRLAAVFGAVVLPSLLFYPSTVHYSEDHKRRLVASQPAQEVLRHRENHMSALQRALTQIDTLDMTAPAFAQNAANRQTLAFRLWMRTDLATLRLTSAIDIYDDTGIRLSRFALNLPSYRQQETLPTTDVTWHVTEDTVPVASVTQRVMVASRGIDVNGRRVGTIAVRLAHDYDTLPFISSHNPYFELFRSTAPERLEGTVADDIELAVYDAQRRPVYASTRPTWGIAEEWLRRIRSEAKPFWTTASRGTARDHTFVFWDAEQIYVLGYPQKSWWAYVLDIAELVVLVGPVYLVCLLGLTLVALAIGRHEIWPMQLPGDVRTSFYGKLLLAFVAASTAPMVILSLAVHAQFTAHIRAEEDATARTNVAVARRVVEGYEAAGRMARVDDDDVMVWIRSLVEQDVNVFVGGRVVATSQRDLFAAGLLPSLAPAPVYQTMVFDRADEYVGTERIGAFGYLMAAAPVRFAGQDGLLTVPFALRQREVDSKIDELDRGLLLVTLVFVLGAAALGYRMAERLAAPISRLTHATRRLAAGDFQTLPVITPSDEVQRLVSAFNRMAADLKAQRERLAHTTRVEASADMARRIAHDIKNPLTPVQLSAEHLLRVVADEGHAPRSVVEQCAENILRQVRTLRQIASEFSTFGTAPVPHAEPWDVRTLLEEIAQSYQSGLDGRVEVVVTMAPDLPPAFGDRVLVARALTNLVENALHAIPDRGRVLLRSVPFDDCRLAIDVIDTGTGIEPDVLPRIFEPYFSTRTGGTGLGMAIVKRNIEATGGTIEVTSTPGAGTCVRVVLPTASEG